MYFDTSVIVALYVPESASAAAQTIADSVDAPMISGWVRVEFASALAIRVRRNNLTLATARRAIEKFDTDINDGDYRMLEMPPTVFRVAANWISEMNSPLRGPDALHLALAHLEEQPIVTFDQQLANSARVLGVKCKLIAR